METKAIKAEKFLGEFYHHGAYVGSLYKSEGGYIVREVKPFARRVGPVLFEGKTFAASELMKIGQTNLGYGVIRRYSFATLGTQ
jgi:hypothetical protein